ncbi:MAG TPA: MotA/TolQ/ExbB proton channel family protein [Verrucomicrobiales bacterium]|nr:MotA/TolQ/ExbB proton channel family protein [Verrucomicrobiales bacterium]
MQLKVEAEHAGKYVRCPGCNTKMQIPAETDETEAEIARSVPRLNIPAPTAALKTSTKQAQETAVAPSAPVERQFGSRGGWTETDPTNANIFMSLGIGAGATTLFLLFLLAFSPPDGTPSSSYTFMQYISRVWTGHLAVNGLNTLFFFWAISILGLKLLKLKHQREAMLLDVLPYELGNQINAENVGIFIDHLYKLPARLRDSLMVNRIRKALELFEIKQSTGDTVHLMSAQSDIDGGRIASSFTAVKAFLWAIPIMGFIGTVLGLSHALLSLSFDNLEDVKAIIGVLKGVISGLGSAFDATLVGLVFAMLVNFPMNGLFKAEDENLNDIDSFCNEVLIPRLSDGAGVAGGDHEAVMNHLVRAVASAQNDFLVDLNALSGTMLQYAENLEARAVEHQQRVSDEFSMVLDRMREDVTLAVADSVRNTTDHTRALADGIGSLNKVLTELGEKQVVINQTIKKGWFSRG